MKTIMKRKIYNILTHWSDQKWNNKKWIPLIDVIDWLRDILLDSMLEDI